ncbi:MAG: FHA domain-containing protein [Kiritimatiellaeota bacterium]|nr:FHA domain-containing protein [Kiritimatiellota bacterium]
MNQTRFYLLVEVGPAKGQRHFIPDNGAKLGRSSNNDICIVDPQLSRQHCAFELRDGHLWVRDLASANFTLVNDAQVAEQLLRPGDRVSVGETVLRVVAEDAPTTNASVIPGVTVAGTAPVAAPPAPIINIPAPGEATAPAKVAPPAHPVIDLGLSKNTEAEAPKNNMARTMLCLVAAVAALVLGVVGMNALFFSSKTEVDNLPTQEDQTLQFEYEKTTLSSDNILRMHVKLTPDGMLSGQISNLAGQRSLSEEKKLQPGDVERLLQSLKQNEGVTRFMALNPEYDALNSNPNHMEEYAVTLVVGKNANKSVVRNRREPPDFENIREILRSFSVIELRFTNFDIPGEELTANAETFLREANTLMAERELDLGNVWRAIRRYEDADATLLSVSPKPSFYSEIVAGREDALKQLETDYNVYRYGADHAIRTEDWRVAQRNLQFIKRLVPDEQNEWHKAANRDLINVEHHLR